MSADPRLAARDALICMSRFTSKEVPFEFPWLSDFRILPGDMTAAVLFSSFSSLKLLPMLLLFDTLLLLLLILLLLLLLLVELNELSLLVFNFCCFCWWWILLAFLVLFVYSKLSPSVSEPCSSESPFLWINKIN